MTNSETGTFNNLLSSPITWFILLVLVIAVAILLNFKTEAEPKNEAKSNEGASLYDGKTIVGNGVTGLQFSLPDIKEIQLEITENNGRVLLQKRNEKPILFESSDTNISKKLLLPKGEYIISVILIKGRKTAEATIRVKD